jgi:hypothetical protein
VDEECDTIDRMLHVLYPEPVGYHQYTFAALSIQIQYQFPVLPAKYGCFSQATATRADISFLWREELA